MSGVMELKRVDWSVLPADLQNVVQALESERLGWDDVTYVDRRGIVLFVLPQLYAGDSMNGFDRARPAWMPVARDIAGLFGRRWVDVVANARRYAQMAW